MNPIHIKITKYAAHNAPRLNHIKTVKITRNTPFITST